VPSHDFLIIADAVAPLADGESPLAAIGLSRALAAAGHRTTVLSLGDASAASKVPGLARRLRTIRASIGDQAVDLSLYEGKAALSGAELLVIGAAPSDRSQTAALLGSAVKSLADDGLLAPTVTIGWGETAAVALSATSAAVRLFVLPSGRVGPPLDPAEARLVNSALLGELAGAPSLVALGSLSANAIIAPSPSTARALEGEPGLAARASDEPFVAVRFGCDDPPHGPSSDPALPATYTADSLQGKAECRRAMARRCSLALGPRTLLLATAPLRKTRHAEGILNALQMLDGFDVVVVVPPGGDAEMVERARVLAIEHPGRIAVAPSEGADGSERGAGGAATERQIRAAADALLLGDEDDRTGRAAGLALLYGTLPIAVDAGASRDYLVDYDPRSATGTALLCSSAQPFEIASAIRRAVALRASSDLWAPLVRALFQNAPRWASTAAAIDEICAQYDLPAPEKALP
jgi:starch synthase